MENRGDQPKTMDPIALVKCELPEKEASRPHTDEKSKIEHKNV